MCTRELSGAVTEFGTSGYTMDQVFVLYDRDSDSIWYPLTETTLDAVAGSRRGEALRILAEPAPQDLESWLEDQPSSLVLLPGAADLHRLHEDGEGL